MQTSGASRRENAEACVTLLSPPSFRACAKRRIPE